MKKLLAILILLVFTGTVNGQTYEILFQLKAGKDINNFISRFNIENEENQILKAKAVANTLNIYKISIPVNSDPEAILKLIQRNEAVAAAQFNNSAYLRLAPNDPMVPQQWSLNNTTQTGGVADADIDAFEAWEISTGGVTAAGDTIVIAVIDDGIDLKHEDLKGNLWKNYNEIPDNGIDDDNNGYIDDFDGWNQILLKDSFLLGWHSTPVSGIIGARSNNNIGLSGVNWNIKIMPVQVNPIDEASILAGYEYILNQRKLYNESNGAKGAFVVATNTSFGIDFTKPDEAPLWCAMYDSLGKYGILNVGATINNKYNVDSVGDIPTTCPSDYLVAVTVTNANDELHNFAGYGPINIDLAAPGINIPVIRSNSTYGTLSGTSFATPHVTGAIGLIYSNSCTDFINDARQFPDSIAKVVKQILLDGVDQLPSLLGKTVSGGRLNVYNSLLLAENYGPCFLASVDDGLDADADINGVLSIYPNPSSDKITINYSNLFTGNNRFILTNALGQKVLVFEDEIKGKGDRSTVINISHLPPGIYYLFIESGFKQNVLHKVVKL